MEGLGRTALGEDLADAAGEASRDFLDPSLVSASSFAIFSPEPSLASRGRFTAVKPCTSCDLLQNGASPHILAHRALSTSSCCAVDPWWRLKPQCHPNSIEGSPTDIVMVSIQVQLRPQHYLSKQLHSGRHRNIRRDVIACRLAPKLVYRGVAGARVDIAPEHAGGRIVHQGHWIRSLSQLIITAVNHPVRQAAYTLAPMAATMALHTSLYNCRRGTGRSHAEDCGDQVQLLGRIRC